jgi:serine/threonine protein kinase
MSRLVDVKKITANVLGLKIDCGNIETYKIKRLGGGSEGLVFSCCGNRLAVKEIEIQDDLPEEEAIRDIAAGLYLKPYIEKGILDTVIEQYDFFFCPDPKHTKIFSFMDLAEGTLNALWPNIDEKQKVNIIKQVCYTLKFLNSIGVSHSDINSHNILYIGCSNGNISCGDAVIKSKGYKIKIADFGMSEITRDPYSGDKDIRMTAYMFFTLENGFQDEPAPTFKSKTRLGKLINTYVLDVYASKGDASIFV